MRWISRFLTCALLGTVLLVGRAGGAGPVVLDVWHVYGDRQGRDALERIRELYAQRRPDVQINYLSMPWNASQKLLTAIVGRVPPDVCMIDRPRTSMWASRGALIPLDELMARDGFDGSQFFANTWEETFYDGHHWTVPINTDARALYYNRELFRRAGLDPDRPPRTWAELEEYALRLERRDAQGRLTQVGFAPLVSRNEGFGTTMLQQYAWQNGGEILSEDGTRVLIDTPPWVEALAWDQALYTALGGDRLRSFLSGTGVYSQDPFISGKVAMWEHGSWYLSTLRRYGPDVDFGLAMLPHPEGGEPAFLAAGWSLGIPKGAQHIGEAWEFIKFFTDTEAQILLATTIDAIPANRAATEIPHFQDDPAWRFFISIMPHARHHPIHPLNWMIYEEGIRAVEDTITAGVSPEVSLGRAAARIQDEMDRLRRAEESPQVNWGRVNAWFLALGAIGLLAFVLHARRRLGTSAIRRQEALQGYLLAAPWLVGLIVFAAGPILVSVVYSLCDYQILTPARWVGFANYTHLVAKDHLFLKSLWNTLYVAVLGVPLSLLVALALAVLLNRPLPGIPLFRTVFYMPSVISGVAVCILWVWLFNSDAGLLNRALGAVGIPGPNWLGSPQWAKPAIILMGLWGVGGSMIVFLAGLQSIPPHLYEVARIDGAGRWKQFRFITLPLLTPTIFFNLVVGFIAAFQIFTQAYVMTQGGPADSTRFYALYLFNQAFEHFNMGYASAMAWILFLVVLAATIVQLLLAKHWVHYEGGREQ